MAKNGGNNNDNDGQHAGASLTAPPARQLTFAPVAKESASGGTTQPRPETPSKPGRRTAAPTSAEKAAEQRKRDKGKRKAEKEERRRAQAANDDSTRTDAQSPKSHFGVESGVRDSRDSEDSKSFGL